MRIKFGPVGLFLFLLPLLLAGQSVKKDEFYVAQWNVENLFDAVDDPEKDDSEFLPESEKFWTDGKLEQKLTNLAKVINYMNDGKGPDVLSVEEVENFSVLKRLVYKLRDRDYMAAERESPDERGIDVGLLYDRSVFDIKALTPIRVELPNKNPTRDILHVTLEHKKTKEIIHFFVNHWPSRRGGKEKSDINREVAAKALRNSVDSILVKTPDANIIMLGDFNDGPLDESITGYLKAKDFDCDAVINKNNLLNISFKKALNKEGSYLYYGKWDMIDQIIISNGLDDGKGIEYECDSFQIIKPEFMVIQEGNRKGGALPTYMGNKHTAGFSDHFPVGGKFYIK
jgi:predicted extracellular nuclease